VAEVREFEDGTVYIYKDGACGNGVFVDSMPIVYNDLNYIMATATFASTFLILAGLLHEKAESFVPL
jgi:hypothetical protein